MYNAIEDAQRMRILRKSIKENSAKLSPDRMLILVLDLVNPELTRPFLVGLRDSLTGKTDDQLDALIAEL